MAKRYLINIFLLIAVLCGFSSCEEDPYYDPYEEITYDLCNYVWTDWFVVDGLDHGIAFDPTLRKDPDITLSAEDRPIGGLGIFLIKKIMDEVSYQRVDERNVFIMKKKITE